MRVVVKTPHIEINVKGSEIPPSLLKFLKKEYGEKLSYLDDDGDELVDITATDWYRNIGERMSPGDYMKVYRENKGLTQEQLGRMLGNIPRQNVSGMERGTRPISLKMARKMAALLGVSVSKLLEGEISS